MPSTSHPWPEEARLAALRRHDVLDTPPEEEFDAFTRLAAHICGTPFSQISLVDRDRQWFKSNIGMPVDETAREVSFCQHAILEPEILEVPDASVDPRFRTSPLVTGPPFIRFYAGATLRTQDGLPIGTLCVSDHEPRELDEAQREGLMLLARQVMTILELRLARRRLVEAGESANEAFVTLDHDFRVTYANPEAERRFRLRGLRRLNRKVWEGSAEGADGPLARRLRRAAQTDAPDRFELYFDPSEMWIEVSVDPSPEGLTLYLRDVTARRQKEDELRLLEIAVSRLNDLVMITEAAPLDEPGPRLVYVNDAFVERLGYSREQALGHSPRFLQGKRTDRAELDRVRAALERGEPVRSELINYTSDGLPLWLELEITPLLDADGVRTHWVAVARDIGERKAADEAARDVQHRLETLIGEARVGIFVHRDFRPLIANDELARMFGYADRGEILALEDCRALFAEEERERVTAFNRERRAGGTPPGFYQTRGLRKDGRVIELENRAFPIRWGDEMAVCAMLTDVSEQHRLEAELRQAQRLEAVGQLTGGIAHDFNNLLTVVLGNAELLEESLEDDPALAALARTTRTAAERGAELTRRLLAFARRQPLDPRPVNVRLLIADLQALMQRTLGEHVEIAVSLPAALWEAVIDPSELESALLNLCVNARDAMPRGGEVTIEAENLTLEAEEHAELAPGDYVAICVSDTGTGMDAATLARAFEPFFTTKDPGKGSGLGLSSVYGFVRQSGGHMAMESEPGRGTRVRLYLPRAGGAAAVAQPRPAQAEAPTGTETVLVVEDNALVRRHAVGLIAGLGYRVVEAGDGNEALRLIEGTPEIELMFTDVVMPGGMNGVELADAARAVRPDLPVVFTSGYTESEALGEGRIRAAGEMVHKPYRRAELAGKLRQALDQATDRPTAPSDT